MHLFQLLMVIYRYVNNCCMDLHISALFRNKFGRNIFQLNNIWLPKNGGEKWNCRKLWLHKENVKKTCLASSLNFIWIANFYLLVPQKKRRTSKKTNFMLTYFLFFLAHFLFIYENKNCWLFDLSLLRKVSFFVIFICVDTFRVLIKEGRLW